MAISEKPSLAAAGGVRTSASDPFDLPAPADFVRVAREAWQGSIAGRFEEMVERSPQHPAVTQGDRSLSFAELNNAANAVAAQILRLGAPEGVPVMIVAGLNLSSVIALVGVIKSGRPYVLVDASTQPERIAAVFEDATSEVLVTTRDLRSVADVLRAQHPSLRVLFLDDIDLKAAAANPGIYPSGDDVCALYYTSGSTGEPKGLVHTHRKLLQPRLKRIEQMHLSPSDRSGVLTSLGFAGSIPSLLDPLLAGSTACLYDFKTLGPGGVGAWLDAQRISIIRLTASVLRAIFEPAPAGKVFPSLRAIILGGEPSVLSDFELFKAHTAPHCVLIAGIGSTDAGLITAASLRHDTILKGGNLPLGVPLPDVEVMLFDEDGHPVPDGEPGEMVIRTYDLAAGYWRNPELTAQKFRPDPERPGQLLFYSGDLARRGLDGMLEFLGRKDSMVKIRGQRVELSEVELRLREHPAVKEAAVLAQPGRLRPDALELVAYVVLQAEQTSTAGELRAHLAGRLPEAMVPAYILFLPRLPLTSQGKIDRRALPGIPERLELEAAELAADATEARLVELWRRHLKTERVGVHDNFFERGGDSLSVLSMLLDVERAFGRPVPRTFFRAPTIRGLAGILNAPEPQSEGTAHSFELEGHRSGGERSGATGNRLRRWLAKRRTDLKLIRKRVDETFPYEWLLAQRALRMPYAPALAHVLRASRETALPGLVYWRKRRLFVRFLRSMGIPSGETDLIGRAVTHNVLFKLIERRPPFRMLRRGRFATDRKRILEAVTAEEQEAWFPVSGLAHLQSALQRGKGVILLAFHGTGQGILANRMLARRLGGLRPQIIAHNLAVESSEFSGVRELMPSTVAGSMYAEVAYFGQQILKQGRIILINGDTFAEGPGRTFTIHIGDRAYEIKPGFAELALNTGAQIIPTFGRILEDGRLQLEFLPPLEAGPGAREQQIERLVHLYEEFVNQAIKAHPEMLFWKRMATHLRRPHASK